MPCPPPVRAFLVSAAGLVISTAPALAEPTLAVAPSTFAAPPTSPAVNTDQSYGDLGRRFVLFLWGKPSLLSSGAIDEMVGNPWKLSLAAEAKLATLPPRLRTEMYLLLAGSLHSYQFVPQSTAIAGGASGSTAEAFPWPTTLAPAVGRQLLNNLTTTAVRHFRTEELADLGVYALSRQAFFPTTPREWRSWKQAIVEDDMLFASAVALGLAATDNLQARASGLLAKLPGNTFRFGWFGEFNDFGFQLHPTLRSGLKVKSPSVEVSAGVKENFAAGTTEELRALELVVNNHWIEQLATPRGWELAVTAVGRYVVAHQVKAKEDAVQTGLDLYFRRPHFAGSAYQSLVIRTNAATDFRTESVAFGAVGLEHRRYDVAALVRVGVSADPWSEPSLSNVGVLIAGGTEPRHDRMRSAMFSSADAVVVRLDNLTMIKAKIAELDVRLLGRVLAPPQRVDMTAEREVWRAYLQRGRTDLEAELKQYMADRDAFYLYTGKATFATYGLDATGHGPLGPALRNAARGEIRGMP